MTRCEVCNYDPSESDGATLAYRSGYVACIRCGDSIEALPTDEAPIVVGVAQFYGCNIPSARKLARTVPAHRALVLTLVERFGMYWPDARNLARRYA